jgi:hypothetical protein
MITSVNSHTTSLSQTFPQEHDNKLFNGYATQQFKELLPEDGPWGEDGKIWMEIFFEEVLTGQSSLSQKVADVHQVNPSKTKALPVASFQKTQVNYLH